MVEELFKCVALKYKIQSILDNDRVGYFRIDEEAAMLILKI